MATSQAFSLKEFLFGKAKDPLDPKVFHQISLVAFLAWVGLGADGLSSACYGPEEAFLALARNFRQRGFGIDSDACVRNRPVTDVGAENLHRRSISPFP